MRKCMLGNFSWLVFVVVACIASGCAMTGGTWKSTTTVDGKTTVTGDEETMKKENAKQNYEADNIEKIKKAEKRKPTDPITVALYRPTVAENLKGSLDAAKMFEMISKEFANDPVIRLVDQKTADAAQKQADDSNKHTINKQLPKVGADVSVFTNVMASEEVGVSKTGKLGKMVAIKFKANIVSHYLPEDRYDAEEAGNIFNNVQVVKAYAKKVCDIIKNKPHIPGQAYKQQSGDEKKKQFENVFKNLFK